MCEQDLLPCTSHFRSGTNELSPAQFTRVWIDLIDQLERSREAAATAW